MPVVETEALILRSYGLADADKIIVCFTRQQGIVRGVAKGAKRLKSRFGSTFEPFTTVKLSYFQKDERELVSIQDAEIIRSSFTIASDPAFLATFSHLADRLLAILPPHDPQETLYRMASACIDAASLEPTALERIQVYFEVWLLKLAGYFPDWDNCSVCHRTLGPDESIAVGRDLQTTCSTCTRISNADLLSGAVPRPNERHQAIQPI